MVESAEARWEYDAVEVGQVGPPITIEITVELISQYAVAVRNDNPAYRPSSGATAERGRILAMPSMITRVAPLRRHDIAANNGFVALERTSENPRQTPFSKCEVRWFAPLRAGDSITSYGKIVDKYERRNNKFVTFRVEAANQRGEMVAEYDYTCIFEYALGQKQREKSR